MQVVLTDNCKGSRPAAQIRLAPGPSAYLPFSTQDPETIMASTPNAGLDEAFVEAQRQRLIELRAQLISDGDAAATNEDTVQMAAGDEPVDDVEDGSRLEQIGNSEALLAHNEARVVAINRALEKINQRTYGVSDGNGEAIGRAHLQVVPEAVLTSEELLAQERRR
jgi:DnaK suppressor protein